MDDRDLIERMRREIQEGVIGKTKDAADWLVNKARQAVGLDTSGYTRKSILKNREAQRTRTFMGEMYFYGYDPKWKKVLPYYDMFPLVIPIERYSDGFLGMNLHYLIPPERAVLLNTLSAHMTNNKYNTSTKITATYQTIIGASRLERAKPTIHRYLYSHVRTKFIYVHPSEWDAAIYLPAAKWSRKK